MTDRHEINPLRPYYIPPSIGRETQPIPNATSSRPVASSSSFSFPDLDYSEYIPEASPSVTGQVRSLLDKALWKYTSVVVAQPFEVAKLILQTRVAQESDLEEHVPSRNYTPVQDYDDEDEDEEPNYFTSAAPFDTTPTRSPTRGRRGRPPRTASYSSESIRSQPQPLHPDHLALKSPNSLLETLSCLSSSSGAFAIFKATNSTFIYTVLLRTLELFLRSFLAATFGIAESDVSLSTSISDTSILTSTSPAATVLIATAATTLSSIVLAPIDAARTRLILTPASQEPRSLLSTIRTLSPSWLCPTHLVAITTLTSSIPTLLATSTPLFLKNYLSLDPAINPTSWSIFTFLASAADLSIKFPLETVLRRAQIATWTAPNLQPPSSKSARKAIRTIVPVPQSYRGILGTMWGIVREEGYSESAKDRVDALAGKAPRRKRRGQGIEGLYRGWRVGLWGLVGVWGSGFVGGLQGTSEAAGAPGTAGKF